MTNKYPFLKIHLKEPFGYADGPIENTIYRDLETFDKVDDEKSLYNYLEGKITDWPTLYHYSWERCNILKPIDWDDSHKVLELGCGTGVLTHYLCQRVSEVVAVEGSAIRASCAAARCKKFNNVEIHVANFFEFDFVQEFGLNSFDKITLIGVLEYSPVFADGDTNGIDRLLRVCHQLLKSDGELIIAIENKVGLKYLLGFEEDHIGAPFYGIEDMYSRNQPITYSEVGLRSVLTQNGFNGINFQYCFPDYKLPCLIWKGDPRGQQKFYNLLQNLTYRMEFINYSGAQRPKVDVSRTMRTMLEAGIFNQVANSFLVTASKNGSSQSECQAYFYPYNRKFEYSSELHFEFNGDQVNALKSWVGVNGDNEILHHKKEGSEKLTFRDGINLAILLEDLRIKDDASRFKGLFDRWLMEIQQYAAKGSLNFDMMPHNFILGEGEDLHIIDCDEYTSSKHLSVTSIVYRFFLYNPHNFEYYKKVTGRDLSTIHELLRSMNLDGDSKDLLSVDSIEDFIKSKIRKTDLTTLFVKKGANTNVRKTLLRRIRDKLLSLIQGF